MEVPVTRVAFLGLGRMGSPMAGRLAAAGYELRVWNRSPGRAAELVAGGATESSTPSDAAAGADVVITMVADPVALREVTFGPKGLADSIGPDAMLVDMSTVGPTAIGEVRDRLAPTAVLDAPVLGSVPHAESGSLVIMAGGEPESLATCRPVLEAMGQVQHVGPPGAGAALKLVNNAVVVTTLVSLGETIPLADRAGTELDAALDALGLGPLASFVTRFGPNLEAPPERVNFSLALARKDLSLAIDEARALGLDPVTLAAALARCDEAIAAGLGDGDNSGVFRHVRGSG
jgi:3-hydroxyisobutyrate dehydrogenase